MLKNKLCKIKGQYRQGDVLLQNITKLPDGLDKQKTGRVILAHGEVTGHSHTIEGFAAEAWKEREEIVAVDVKTKISVKHQEHGEIPLIEKTYKVRRQSEYSPTEFRSVVD